MEFYSTWVFPLPRMEWMSHLVSWNCKSTLSQGNTWKYCTRLPIPFAVPLSYKAIIENQNISRHWYGPKKCNVWFLTCFTALVKKQNPSWKVPLWMFSATCIWHFLLHVLKIDLCSPKWSRRLFCVFLWRENAHFCAQLVELLSTGLLLVSPSN